MSTSVIFLALIIIVCILLVVVIMVQNPKGSGLSGTFGGGGQQMGGVKRTDDFLTKSTWTLATALLVLVLLFNVSNKGGNGVPESRLLDGTPTSVPSATESESQDSQNDNSTIDLRDLEENSSGGDTATDE